MAKPHIITGLDIGSGTTKALAVSLGKTDGRLDFLALVEEFSSGVRKGVVINPVETSLVIKSVLSKISQQLPREPDSVYVNVGGSHIFSHLSRGLVSVSRADQSISQEDIDRVLQAAQTFPVPANREILEVVLQEFIVDGERGIKEAQGLKGVRLEAEVLALGGFSPYVKNLTTAVLNSGLQINDLILSPLAASRAVLSPREKELGVGLLDIGAGNTGFALFEEGELVHLNILPMGSANITNDIAIYLKSDIDTAERIKLEFGTLLFQGQDKKEKIQSGDDETIVFSKKQIAKVIEDRVSEIFSEVNKELKKIGKQQKLPSGIVLTGGGANLPKIKELAKKEFRLPCRLGQTKEFSLPEPDSRFSTLCGLVLLGVDLEGGITGWKESAAVSGQGIKDRLKKIFKVFIP